MCRGERASGVRGCQGPSLTSYLPVCPSGTTGQARVGAAWQEGYSDLRRAGLQALDTPDPSSHPPSSSLQTPMDRKQPCQWRGPPCQGSKGVLLHRASALSPGLGTCPWSGTPFSCPACQMPHQEPPAHPLNPLCMATTQALSHQKLQGQGCGSLAPQGLSWATWAELEGARPPKSPGPTTQTHPSPRHTWWHRHGALRLTLTPAHRGAPQGCSQSTVLRLAWD